MLALIIVFAQNMRNAIDILHCLDIHQKSFHTQTFLIKPLYLYRVNFGAFINKPGKDYRNGSYTRQDIHNNPTSKESNLKEGQKWSGPPLHTCQFFPSTLQGKASLLCKQPQKLRTKFSCFELELLVHEKSKTNHQDSTLAEKFLQKYLRNMVLFLQPI